MKVRSIRREIQILRVYALVSTVAAGAFLLGAVHEAKNASFDTITVHRINVVDREDRRAMVITDHDDFPQPIMNGKSGNRGGGNDQNGIVFYNQLGNEQGALLWYGRATGDTGDLISYDTAQTSDVLKVSAIHSLTGDEAAVYGYSSPLYSTLQSTACAQFHSAFKAAPSGPARFALRQQFPQCNTHRRFFVGYDGDNKSRVMLQDATGRPRIDMFVSPNGDAKLQFLDADGKVTFQLPQ
jgi:hypothetical protein